MRRLMSFLAIVVISSVLTGCRGTGSCGTGCDTGCGTGGCGTGGRVHGKGHAHGICDCEYDDYCTSRSPWIRVSASQPIQSAPTIPSSEPIPAPAKLPDVKKGL